MIILVLIMIKSILTLLALLTSFAGFGQQGNLFTFNKRNASITEVIDDIALQSSYTFWYRSDIPDQTKPIKLKLSNASIEKVMELCTEGQPFTYRKIDNVLVLIPDSNFSKKPLTKKNTLNSTLNKKGFITDGYSEHDRRTSTSSITTLSGKELNPSTTSGIFDNTSVNGLQISKDAKNNTSMLIRGKNTIMGSSEPLIVLDGIPYEGNINQIDRENIESVNVLKDAGATAIYGSRGGNGVIVITTKKARFMDNKLVPFPNSITEKEGFIYFRNASGYDILDHMTKHFGVKLVLKAGVPAESFTGKIPSAMPLVKMTEILKAVGLDVVALK